MPEHPPTPHPQVNHLLSILQERIQAILGPRLTGLYLDGSLARGGFDAASDIDLVAVTEDELTPAEFAALAEMHAEIGALPVPLAQEIEIFYVTRAAIRRYDPRHARFANLERGPAERLKWVAQDQYWVVHRAVLRDYGIALCGPGIASLVDPVSPDALRRTMSTVLEEWGLYLRQNPGLAAQPGYQPYAVLTICRILYTLNTGEIAPKTEAAAWALEKLPEEWHALISAALTDRMASPCPAPTPAQTQATLAFLGFAETYEAGYWGRKFCHG